MKTREEILERINNYEFLIERRQEELEEYKFYGNKKRAKEVEERILRLTAKILALEWVLDD